MKVLMYSAKRYDQESFNAAAGSHTVDMIEDRLNARTAALAAGYDAVCLFVNDRADAATLERLAESGVKHLALRCAGFNNVDLRRAEELGLTVVRVPAYSPHAVAEHTIALVLGLDRKLPRACSRVREGNFALDGLVGFDLYGKTVGVIGTGRIGALVAKLFQSFGCTVVAHDPVENPEVLDADIPYISLPRLYADSDIVSLNCPLTADTYHLIDQSAVTAMKPGVMLVNTGRGALIDTKAVVKGLKSGRIGALAIDVYEDEGDLFFEDRSAEVLDDDVFARLTTFPNVLVTAHQAFLTNEALAAIASTTLGNLDDLEAGRDCPNLVPA